MISTAQTLLLLFFATRSSENFITDDSMNLCSNVSVNHNNYKPLKLEEGGFEKNCIRKCCSSGFYYYHEGNSTDGQLTGECEEDGSVEEFSVPIYDIDKKIEDKNNGFSVGKLNCTNQNVVEIDLERTDSIYHFYIQYNGSRYYPYLNTIDNNTNYCINAKNGITKYYYCKNPLNQNMPFHRADLIIPIPFQLATALVYIILPRRNTHRKALILHISCQAVSYTLITVDQFDVMENVTTCKVLGNLMMYFWYGGIIWMNVMCIDIWLTFSGLYELRRRLGKENVLFIFLSIYAWGFAGLSLLVTRLFDVLGASPVIYNQGCFRPVLPSYWFYFATISISTIANSTLYILTTINIRKARREVTVLKHADSGTHNRVGDDKFTLYWNLFCVMSTLSTLYYLRLVHITLGKFGWHYTGFDMFVQFMFGSYAIVIFIVFVCKKRVWKELKERYRHFVGKTKENENSISTTLSIKSLSVVAVSNVNLTHFEDINEEEASPEI